jgi:hypothetical protein
MKARAIGNCTPWSVDEPAGVAHALGGDQDPLGVQSVEHLPEAGPLFADECVEGETQIVDEEGVRLMVDHGLDRSNVDG